MPYYKTAIFDLDGLLIKSEEFWEEAQYTIIAKHNLEVDKSKSKKTTGLRIDELVAYWNEFYSLGYNYTKVRFIADEIMDEVVRLIKEKSILLPGALHALSLTKSTFGKIGLASSSFDKVIFPVLEHFEIDHYFDVICSAEHEKYGKPNPSVYLTACHKLKVDPIYAIAFEDSLNGVLAAKSGQLKCIAVPSEKDASSPKFSIADISLKSLEDLNIEHLE